MLKVILPALFGDTDNTVQSRVSQALAATDEIHVTTLPGLLPPEDVLPEGEISFPLTEEFGAGFLQDEDAHIMVWGEILEEEALVRLRFFVNPHLSDEDSPLKLDDWLELPLDMPASVGKTLSAVTAAAAAHGINQGEYSPMPLAVTLFPDMEALTEDPPETLSRSGLHTLLYFVVRMRKLFFLISDDNLSLIHI